MPGFFKSIGNFFLGTPEKRENVSMLRPEQEGLYQQLLGASKGAGAGGAFGSAADYYRGLLGDNSADFQSFAAPTMRQYQQDIVPGLSEQFAGMGSGALSSSGFRNAQVQGATDLAERLGAIRASLRQAGAQGLQNLGGLGLQSYSQNIATQPGTQGFLSGIAPLAGIGLGSALGGGLSNWFNTPRNYSDNAGASLGPYGPQGPKASPDIAPNQQLPNFMQNTRYGGY